MENKLREDDRMTLLAAASYHSRQADFAGPSQEIHERYCSAIRVAERRIVALETALLEMQDACGGCELPEMVSEYVGDGYSCRALDGVIADNEELDVKSCPCPVCKNQMRRVPSVAWQCPNDCKPEGYTTDSEG